MRAGKASNGKFSFFDSNGPFLIAFFVNFAIFLSTLLIISLFPRDANLPLQLANTPRNFPFGSITAVYSPDTQVFLDFMSWKSWYLLTLANFTVFLALFLILNWNLQKRQRGLRFVFYSVVFVVLPIVANMLNILLINQSTLGPSGAYFASDGLVVGFGLVNLWAGDKAGGLREMVMARKIDALLFVLNGVIGTGFLLLSFIDPTDFFSEVVAGYNVGYGIHIFCFYAAVVLSLLFGYLRRSSLVVPRLPSVDANVSI